MGRLRDLDDKALGARWGLLVAPLAWLAYRAGRKAGPTEDNRWLYFLFGGPLGAVFHRGRQASGNDEGGRSA